MTTKSKLFQTALTMPRIDTHGHFHGPIPELETYAISEQEMDSIAAIRPQYYHTIAVGAEVLYGSKVGAFLLKNKHRAVLEKGRTLRKKLARKLCRKHSKQHTSQLSSVSVIFIVLMYVKKRRLYLLLNFLLT